MSPLMSLLTELQTKHLIDDAETINSLLCYSTFLALYRLYQVFPKQRVYEKLTNTYVPRILFANEKYEKDFYLLSLFSERKLEAKQSFQHNQFHLQQALQSLLKLIIKNNDSPLQKEETITKEVLPALKRANSYNYSQKICLQTTLFSYLLLLPKKEEREQKQEDIIEDLFEQLDLFLSPAHLATEQISSQQITSFLLNVLPNTIQHPNEHPSIHALNLQPHHPFPSASSNTKSYRAAADAIITDFYRIIKVNQERQLNKRLLLFGHFLSFFAQLVVLLETEQFEYLPHILLMLQSIQQQHVNDNSDISNKMEKIQLQRFLQSVISCSISHCVENPNNNNTMIPPALASFLHVDELGNCQMTILPKSNDNNDDSYNNINQQREREREEEAKKKQPILIEFQEQSTDLVNHHGQLTVTNTSREQLFIELTCFTHRFLQQLSSSSSH